MSNTEQQAVMDGFMKNAQGFMVPVDLVKPVDKLRDELVMRVVRKAVDLQKAIIAFKDEVQQEMDAFIALSTEQYGSKLGGGKGNVQLSSYDGRFRLMRANADTIFFDERLLAAKALIDSCINRWAAGSSSEIRVLVEQAFQTDKIGKISTSRIIGLLKLDITDPEWQEAMQAIRDSITVSGCKTYFRIYQRIGNSENWQPITLDIASL